MDFLFQYIEKLQKAPIEERNRVALILSSTLTGLIFIIWLSTLPFRGAEKSSVDEEKIDLTPLNNISGALKEVTSELKGAASVFKSLKDSEGSIGPNSSGHDKAVATTAIDALRQ